MLSYAGTEAGGVGWVSGLHEALDQARAMVGPLAVALVLARQGNVHLASAESRRWPEGVNAELPAFTGHAL